MENIVRIIIHYPVIITVAMPVVLVLALLFLRFTSKRADSRFFGINVEDVGPAIVNLKISLKNLLVLTGCLFVVPVIMVLLSSSAGLFMLIIGAAANVVALWIGFHLAFAEHIYVAQLKERVVKLVFNAMIIIFFLFLTVMFLNLDFGNVVHYASSYHLFNIWLIDISFGVSIIYLSVFFIVLAWQMHRLFMRQYSGRGRSRKVVIAKVDSETYLRAMKAHDNQWILMPCEITKNQVGKLFGLFEYEYHIVTIQKGKYITKHSDAFEFNIQIDCTIRVAE